MILKSLSENYSLKCDYCKIVCTDKPMERGTPEEAIFYNEKEDKYYLVVEECRGERIRIEINYCLKCGRNLRAGSRI